MENGSRIQVEPIIELIQDQLGILLSLMTRPVVQLQIFVIFLILLISWILPEAMRRRHEKQKLEKSQSSSTAGPRTHRWLAALSHLLNPILALVLLNISIWLLARQEIPNGLLEDFTILIWIWLVYRGLITFLFARYGEAVRPFRNRLITPFFLFLIVWQILDITPGSITVVNATISLGSLSVSFGILIYSLIILYLFIVLAWMVKQIMLYTLPSRLQAEPGVIESVATLTRYSLLALGVLVSLSILGLDFTSLAIIAGGLSVGIGIGLQDIVANFVSGLVLLFEQSLRPGDVVELDGRISQVEKISLRATIVRTRTNEELIIPNSNFTTQQVKNLTKTDRLVQVLIPLGVSYKSDPEQVRQLATETALEHPLVLTLPPPRLIFRSFGESSLNFDLAVSVNQPEMSINIKSDLYYLLWNVFAENGIQIPFPQRDLNLGDGWDKLAAENLQTSAP